MARRGLTLELVHPVLVKHNGRIKPTADELDVLPHTLRTFIDQHAELQAINRNREVILADIAIDILVDCALDDRTDCWGKYHLAKYLSERLLSDRFGTKADLNVTNKSVIDGMNIDQIDALLAEHGYVKKDDTGANS